MGDNVNLTETSKGVNQKGDQSLYTAYRGLFCISHLASNFIILACTDLKHAFNLR